MNTPIDTDKKKNQHLPDHSDLAKLYPVPSELTYSDHPSQPDTVRDSPISNSSKIGTFAAMTLGGMTLWPLVLCGITLTFIIRASRSDIVFLTLLLIILMSVFSYILIRQTYRRTAKKLEASDIGAATFFIYTLGITCLAFQPLSVALGRVLQGSALLFLTGASLLCVGAVSAWLLIYLKDSSRLSNARRLAMLIAPVLIAAIWIAVELLRTASEA